MSLTEVKNALIICIPLNVRVLSMLQHHVQRSQTLVWKVGVLLSSLLPHHLVVIHPLRFIQSLLS